MKFAVVIPAFNASSTLGPLLERVQRYVSVNDVCVVDDGSTDSTAQVARQHIAMVVQHERNHGKGAALRTGFTTMVSRACYDAVFTLDADLQHDPDEIPAFARDWEKGESDFLVGARKKLGSGMPPHRIMSNGITSFLVSARTGVAIADSQSGYRLISTEVLGSVPFESDGYEAETELLIRAAQKNFRIGFVPISTIYGSERSSMTHWHTTKRFLTVLMKEY